jgi:hypothetical protein
MKSVQLFLLYCRNFFFFYTQKSLYCSNSFITLTVLEC